LNENIVFRFKIYCAQSFSSRFPHPSHHAYHTTHRPPHKFFGKTNQKTEERRKKEKKKAHSSGQWNGLVKVFAKKKLLRNGMFF
jgi:hypothetical protein